MSNKHYAQMTIDKMAESIQKNKVERKTANFFCTITPTMKSDFDEALKYYGFTKNEWLEYNINQFIEVYREDIKL